MEKKKLVLWSSAWMRVRKVLGHCEEWSGKEGKCMEVRGPGKQGIDDDKRGKELVRDR